MQSNPKISAETTMKQLQELMPGARRALFAKYHIGGCQSCGFDDSETIGDVCIRMCNFLPCMIFYLWEKWKFIFLLVNNNQC